MFGKNSIDGNKSSGNLAIHVADSFITFYLIILHANGYIMTELPRLQVPMFVLKAPDYFTNLSRLKNGIYTFETFCTPNSNNDDISS